MSRRWWKLVSPIGLALLVISCSEKPQVPSTDSPQVTANNPSPTPLPAPKKVWMTQFQQLNGTPYLYAPIYVAEQEQRSVLKQIKSASSGSYREWENGDIDIRNYMFVHRDNLAASKLLTNNNSRILAMEQLGETSPPAKSNPDPNRDNGMKTVKALWFVRVVADTNGDKNLSDLDRKQIAIADVSGTNYTEVIQDIDTILLVYPKGLDRRLVFYTSGPKHFVADVDIAKRKAIIKELPSL
jgi:hypothetical protein